MAVRVTPYQPGVAALHAGLSAGVEALAHELALAAEKGKPKGSTVKIEHPVQTPNGLMIRVSWDGPALFKEHGTVAHREEPVNARALKLAGGKGFAAHVEHPATRAEPFINPALIETAEHAGPTIAAGIRSRFR